MRLLLENTDDAGLAVHELGAEAQQPLLVRRRRSRRRCEELFDEILDVTVVDRVLRTLHGVNSLFTSERALDPKTDAVYLHSAR